MHHHACARKAPCEVCKHVVRLRLDGTFLGCAKDSEVTDEEMMDDEQCETFELDGDIESE